MKGLKILKTKIFISIQLSEMHGIERVNKSRPPVKEVAMKISKPFSEIETSDEPVRTSNYLRYLGLHLDEPWMQYDAYECLLQLLAKFTEILMMTAYLRLISYSQTSCINYGHTAYHVLMAFCI